MNATPSQEPSDPQMISVEQHGTFDHVPWKKGGIFYNIPWQAVLC
jgi:hypothetical protein